MQDAIAKAAALVEALPYIQGFAGKPVVIKFGGNAMQSEAVLDGVLRDAVFLAAVRIRPIIVHGGGPQISAAMSRAGLAPRFIHGHRHTDAETLRVVVQVLTEEINRDIVRRIEAQGGRAASTFHDGRSPLRAARKTITAPGPDGGSQRLDLGFVGEVTSVDADAMLAAAREGTILAVPPVGQDEDGQLYNVNADTAAAAVAGALGAEKIVFLSNVHGIMGRADDPGSLLCTVNEREVEELIARGVITGGMLPKVSACIAALDAGVPKAHIIDGRLPHSLLLEIFTDEGVGTQILSEPDLPPT